MATPYPRRESVPLTAEEFTRLQDLLEGGAGRDYMNIERLDGYFAAAVCSPVQASTGLRFGPVFGVEVLAEAELVDVATVEALLWRHWRTIDATLQAALTDPTIQYVPLLYEEADGSVAGNEWARGFRRGVEEDAAPWLRFARAHPGALDPVERLAAESERGTRLTPQVRAELLVEIAALLVTAYRYFEPERG